MTRALPSSAGPDAAGPVIPSLSFEALLQRRDAAIERLRTIAQAVREYHDLGNVIFERDDRPGHYDPAPYKFREPIELRASGRGVDLTDDRWLERAVANVDAALWDHLLSESGLRSFLDAKARKEWADQIEKNETPPLTLENVRATFARLHAQRGEFFERGVIEVFKGLSWDYKTNRPRKFGKRLILRCVVDGYGHPTSHRSDTLDDLERAFYLLDGQPEPDHRESVNARLWRRNKEERREDLEDGYLRIRLYKNGNGHVTLLRPDLTDELNRILARHYPDALPPDLEAA